jgi:hypothetical protein
MAKNLLHCVLVYPSNENKQIKTLEDMKNLLKKQINPKNCKIKPDRIVKLRNNGIMIESTSKEIETLLDSGKLKEAKLEARKPKKMWPKAVIYNVPLHIEEE